MNMEQLLSAGSEGQDLKRQRGRQSTEEEGSSLARALPSAHIIHTPGAGPGRGQSKSAHNRLNNSDASRTEDSKHKQLILSQPTACLYVCLHSCTNRGKRSR